MRQSLDTVGAFAGPLLAIGLLIVLANDVRAVFWVAVIPALIAVAILVLAVKEPPHLVPMQGRLVDLRSRDLPSAFWVVAAVAAMFTLARFSEAFLVLRGSNTGLSITWTPLVLVVMNITYMLSAYPAGALADRMPRTQLLMLGCAILVVSNLVLASAQTTAVVLVGTAPGDCTWDSPKELSVQWLRMQPLRACAARRSVSSTC